MLRNAMSMNPAGGDGEPAERPWRVDVLGAGPEPRWEARASFRFGWEARDYYDEMRKQGLDARLVEELPAVRRERVVVEGRGPRRAAS
jgi:hypothetical protein